MSENTKRTAWLTVRITPVEKDALTEEAKAEGMSLGDYVRLRLEQPRVRRTRAEREKVLQLARIGNNLNQLGRWANTHKSTADAAEILLQLLAIEERLSCL